MANDSEALLLQIAYDLNKLQKQSDAAVGIVNAGSGRMAAGARAAAAEIEKSYGTVTLDGFKASLLETAKLQDRLTAAQAAGNRQEAKGLADTLALQKAVQKASALQLETQLAVAKASGNVRQAAALQEALALSQQMQKLSGVGLGGTKGLAEAERGLLAVAAAERAAEKAGVGLAATRVFDSAKLATLEEGGARLRLFGSALEPLGGAGIAAAAGVVALALAAEEARKAMEWATTLEKTSQALGVSTDSLQKLDYAAVASSLGLEKGREALGEFNIAVGKFETHTGDARLKKWAVALKLDRDEVNATRDPVEKLALVMSKIATLRDTPSRSAAAKAFGLEGLLPIINGGSEAIEGFIGKMKEAQGVGGVISSADIARATELNEKVEALAFLIGQHFKEAFIEAAPAIEKVAEFIERVTKALAGFIGEIPQAIRGLQDLIDKVPHLPKGVHVDVEGAVEGTARAVGLGPGIDLARAARAGFEGLAARGRAAKLQEGIADLMAGKKVEFAGSELGATKNQGTGQQLTFDKVAKKKGAVDDTKRKTDEADAALDGATAKLLSALAALTDDIRARAGFEKQALDEETAKQNAELQAKIDAINADKGIGDLRKVRLMSELELAKIANDQAALARKQKIDRDAGFAIEAKADETTKELNAAELNQLELAFALATTQAERNRIEREILALKQAEALHLKATQLSNQVQTGALSQDEADQRFKSFLGGQSTERAQQAQAQQTPIERYTRSVQDLNTVMQNAAVTAAHDLSTGLADAIVNAKSLGDVASSVFKQLIAQILSAAIEKDVAVPILALLGLAEGGRVSGPGTSTSDSIPALLSDGEYVVNAAATAKHGRLLEAINSGQIPRFAAGGPVPSLGRSFEALHTLSVPQARGAGPIVQNFYPDFRGAVVTQDLIDGLKAYSRSTAASAASGALRQANKSFPARQRAFSLLGTP